LPDGRWCGQLSWEELKDIQIDGEPLPLLEDVLVWARDTDVILSLDLKTIFSSEGALAQEVVRSLERTNTKDKILLLFVDHNELFQIKLAYPDLTVRALVTGRLAGYADYLQKIKADSVSLTYGMFRSSDVDELHAAAISMVLGGLWDLKTDLFHSNDIDVFSYGNPAEAREILNHL
jgi:hypothetical protein